VRCKSVDAGDVDFCPLVASLDLLGPPPLVPACAKRDFLPNKSLLRGCCCVSWSARVARGDGAAAATEDGVV
jgi:hypothetical protein